MRQRLAVVAAVVLLASCTGDGADRGQASSTTTTTQQRSAETIVIQRALPDPVEVTGEVEVFDGRTTSEAAWRRDGLWIAFAADFTERNDLVLCPRITAGWGPCTALGSGGGGTSMWLPADGAAAEVYLLLTAGDGMQPLRRLLTVSSADASPAYRLGAGYETVADVLTKQPPPGGNYLEPAP